MPPSASSQFETHGHRSIALFCSIAQLEEFLGAKVRYLCVSPYVIPVMNFTQDLLCVLFQQSVTSNNAIYISDAAPSGTCLDDCISIFSFFGRYKLNYLREKVSLVYLCQWQ